MQLAKALWGWAPHETQKEWMLTDAKIKVAACGRRWGKTEAAAIDAAVLAILKPGSRQIIVSPSYDQSRLIVDTVDRFLSSNPITASISRFIKTPYPHIEIGKSIISARTADEDGRNLRGNWADRVIVDEAAYVRDSVINEVISPMLADRNGELVMISTPFGRNHFYRAFIRGQNGSDDRCISFRFPSSSNPYISREFIESQRQIITQRQFAVEYEAQFIEDTNAVFSSTDIQRAVRNIQIQHSAWTTIGIDWARYSDYTALIAMQEGSVIAVERMNGLPWHVQIDKAVDFIRKTGGNVIMADQTSIGDPLNEQLRQRLNETGMDVRVEGLVFTAQSKRELIDNLALGLARDLIKIPENMDLISELSFYEYELSDTGYVKMGARSGCHDDLVTALALAWKATGTTSPGTILTSDKSRPDPWMPV